MPKSKRIREGYELHSITDDLTLSKAFQLAHSIYRHRESDRKVALDIVWEAVRGIDVRLLAQHEADRHDPQNPTKVRWSTLQWFQILIYCKSEAHELQQEVHNKTSLSEEDMIIRYLKHLILATTRRNSFHISLGLSRLLYDYNAAETMAIYDLVFQDADSSTRKADAYYRARKNKLIEELEKRFHRFVRIYQGPRGEKRFQSQDDSTQFNELVLQYLSRFTPWETRCELPKQLDTWTTVRSLQSSQASQIHSLIHPTCFARIVAVLKLDPPEKHLVLPRFFHTKKLSNKSTPDDNSPSELTQQEASEIRNKIAEQENSRKKFITRSLSVLADGIERARVELAQSSQVRLDIEDTATLIEIVGHGKEGELLLATHILTNEEDDKAEKKAEYSIVLEGGQKISLRLLTQSRGEHTSAFSVEIKYQETNAIRAAHLRLRQVKHHLFEKTVRQTWRDIPLLSPTVAVATLALIAAAFALYLALRSGPSDHIAKQQPQPPSSGIDSGRLPLSGTTSTPLTSPIAEVTPTTPSAKHEPSIPGNRSQPGGTTREQTASASKSLLNVQRIYVESFGVDAFSQRVRQELIERLQAGNRFVIMNSPDEADTAISGLAQKIGRRKTEGASQEVDVGIGTLKLVNVAGEIIWHTRTHRGTAEKIATQFTKDLLAAIETEKHRPKNE
jgi:hypothetical protein